MQETGGCDGAGRHDVDALDGFDHLPRGNGRFSFNNVGLTVGALEDVVDGTNLAVGRPLVEQVVGIHLNFLGREILRHKVVAPRLPGVVNGVVLHVLRNMLARGRPFEQAGFDQALRHFVNADGPGSATDSLEVVIG